MSSVLGIDPGLNGGFAIRGKDYVIVEPMMVASDGLDLPSIARWLNAHRDEIKLALLEEQSVRPGTRQGTVSAFKTGKGFGCLIGILSTLGIPYQIIPPQKWSKEFDHGVTEKDRDLRYRLIKHARKRIVGELFPRVDLRETERCKTAHEGMTDALLIAEYGYRQTTRGNL